MKPATPQTNRQFAPRRIRTESVCGFFAWIALALGLHVVGTPAARADWPPDGVGLAPYVPAGASNASDSEIMPDGSGGAIVTWADYRSGNWDIYAQWVSANGAAQWTTDGVPLCTAGGNQQYPQIAADGSGGAIVTWADYRSGNWDIYAQRVSANGAVQWLIDGVSVCTAGGGQGLPQIIPDGTGGAIVAWHDSRSGNNVIYAQRVSVGGDVQWTTDGVPLCTAEGDQVQPQIAPDGTGGAIVTWYNYRSGNSDIGAQRVSASGAVQWTVDGVPLCTAGDNQLYPQIAADGSGGAIITWQDDRSGSADIYAQRVSAGGVVQWTTDGVPLCTAGDNQLYPQIAADGSGGAIITWEDYRSGGSQIYAQTVSASGVVQWTVDGVPLCTAGGGLLQPQIAPDGTGGAIVTWADFRSGNWNIYAQRVSASGDMQWITDGVPLCTAGAIQWYPQIATDGSGGAIVIWEDYRSGNWDIYAQRVSVSGVVQWTTGGVPLCAAGSPQSSPQIAADGSGGAIVTWCASRSGKTDIYAQLVSESGAVQWTAGGVPLGTAEGDQLQPQIATDGSGGAIVAWYDYRSGNYDIYAQRVIASGDVLWTNDGVPLCTAGGIQRYPQIVPDGLGGAIVTWYDYRSGNSHIYAQSVSASGVVQWTTDGVLLCTAGGNQQFPQIAADGSGGAVVVWEDYRSGSADIYAQSVSASGVVQWATDGVPLCTAGGEQLQPQIATDGSGGATVTWYDNRSGNYDIYAQRVSASGVVQWTFDGVPLCTAGAIQRYPQIAADGSGCAIVTWQDDRSGISDIYAQRVSASGVVEWITDGVPLCAAVAIQRYPQIAADGSGGAIATWYDYRGGNTDIYAQLVSASGVVQWTVDGVPLCTALGSQQDPQIAADGSGCAIVTWEDSRSGESQIYAQQTECVPPADMNDQGQRWETALLDVSPNPSTGTVTIRYSLAGGAAARLEIFDVGGRLVRSLAEGQVGTGPRTLKWDGRDRFGGRVGSGNYFLRFQAGGRVWTRAIVLLR